MRVCRLTTLQYNTKLVIIRYFRVIQTGDGETQAQQWLIGAPQRLLAKA